MSESSVIFMMPVVPPNVPDQRLAALGSAFTHDDAREPFASGGYVAD
jgi:hypothetical protein